jgi:hypothetical protein
MVQHSRAVPKQWGDITEPFQGACLDCNTVSSHGSHDAMAAISHFVNRTTGQKVRHGALGCMDRVCSQRALHLWRYGQSRARRTVGRSTGRVSGPSAEAGACDKSEQGATRALQAVCGLADERWPGVRSKLVPSYMLYSSTHAYDFHVERISSDGGAKCARDASTCRPGAGAVACRSQCALTRACE